MRKYVFLVFVISVAVLAFFIFKKDEVIKIGFVGGLSGKYSTLGHSVLNGFLLALDDKQNQLEGKKLKVIVKDDMQDEKSAKEIIRYFIDEKINLIIGNTTSAMTKISLKEISSNRDVFLFSATSSSGDFSDIDDNFFRVQESLSKERFDLLSKYLLNKKIKNLYAVYDLKNASYANNYIKNFQDSFISNGGNRFVAKSSFNESFETILNSIKETKDIDGFFIVANSLDCSKLIQFLRINGIKQSVITSSWAKNPEFIEDGGKAVEGTLFIDSYDENSTNKEYVEFTKKYKQRFNIEPTIFSAQGYEAGKVIIDILKKDSDINNFKKTLLGIKKFKGLQGYITFNEYGDVKREPNLTIVKNGRFEKIE